MTDRYLIKLEEKIREIGWIIRRWDSAPHHRELNSFPFHVHTFEEVFESKRINLLQAIDKVTEIILQSI
jgi:hypothetical protein